MNRSSEQIIYDDDDDNSLSILPLEYEDLLVESKASDVSINDLIEKHFERYFSRHLQNNCKCNSYSSFIHAGPFILGTQLNDAQFVDLDTYIARRIDDLAINHYYLLKIVTLPQKKEDETYSQRQAKLLLYNEFSVLSLLKDQEGVIHHQGLYIDNFYENISEKTPFDDSNGDKSSAEFDLLQNGESNEKPNIQRHDKPVDTSNSPGKADNLSKGRLMRRVILALDCYIPHIYCSTVYPLAKLFSRFTTVNSEYENLQEYVKRYKNIPEMRALLIFKQIVNVIFELHQKNIAHRDLRLENILFSHRNEKIILVNFGLARYVINDSTCICDHRGSSAYISPDVLKRKPYNPKASDCWALGIIFYTMLFGKFPFYADSFNELFKKINSGQFTIPSNVLIWKNSHELQPTKTENHSIVVYDGTIQLIHSLIVTDASKRMNIRDLKERLGKLIEAKFKSKINSYNSFLVKTGKCFNNDLQVVPDIDMLKLQSPKPKSNALKRNSSHDKILTRLSTPRAIADSLDMMERSMEMEDLDSNPTNNIQSSLVPLSASDSFERQSQQLIEEVETVRKLDTGEHLHDHNYFHKDQDAYENDDCYAFKAYLESPEFQSPSKLFTSSFSLQQNRFYLMCEPSVYSTNFKNYNSLLLDEFEKPSKNETPNKRLRTRSSMSNDLNAIVPRQPYKGFVRLGSKMAKSNFSVLKIDSDIRSLNENEINLVKNYASYHTNAQ